MPLPTFFWILLLLPTLPAAHAALSSPNAFRRCVLLFSVAAAAAPPTMEASSSFVLDSALAIQELSSRVHISSQAVEAAVANLTVAEVNEITSPKAFDEDLHYNDGGILTAQYLLVVDALNFCFWPDPDLSYEHMSKGVKAAVLKDSNSISAERLACITGPEVRDDFFRWPRDVPQQEERARLLREVGSVLLEHFEGQAWKLVEAAGGSALKLVQLVAMYLPGFRDHAVYKGRQVFLYKRAQIFAGDLYGAFQGRGLGHFHDLDRITTFADYRVPVVLNVMGILKYSDSLQTKILDGQVLEPGSEEEVEIRAATIVGVDRLRQAVAQRFDAAAAAGAGAAAGGSSCEEAAPSRPSGQQQGQGQGQVSGLERGVPCAVQLDWWLWHLGERQREQHPPHHKTLTIFY